MNGSLAASFVQLLGRSDDLSVRPSLASGRNLAADSGTAKARSHCENNILP